MSEKMGKSFVFILEITDSNFLIAKTFEKCLNTKIGSFLLNQYGILGKYSFLASK